MGWNYLSIPKFQWWKCWSLGMDKAISSHTLLGIKLIHVSKRHSRPQLVKPWPKLVDTALLSNFSFLIFFHISMPGFSWLINHWWAGLMTSDKLGARPIALWMLSGKNVMEIYSSWQRFKGLCGYINSLSGHHNRKSKPPNVIFILLSKITILLKV